MNQLIREDIKIVGQLSKTLVYSYDSQNNITSIKTYGYQTISGTPLSEKKMYYQNTWKDQLTRVEYYTNGTLSYYETMTYDNSGNIILIQDSRTYYNDKTFQWDGRQLTNYGSYCNSLTFKYNDQGIRTQKIQSSCGGNVTTNYVLDGDKVLVETKSNGITIYYTYDVDGSLLSMNYNGTEYFYITNLQGDVIELRDMSGYVVVEYKYDAWGNIVYQFGGTLADINPYRYRGYRFDVETGYYYLQSRYYNPLIGRFNSADCTSNNAIQLLNYFQYSLNNPVNFDSQFGYHINSILINNYSLLARSVSCTSINSYLIDYDTPPNHPDYRAPKNPDHAKRKVRAPGGRGDKGWMDSKGKVWVPDNEMHGGEGWRRHNPDGTHDHVYPDGHVRVHKIDTTHRLISEMLLLVWLVGNDISGVGVGDDPLIPVVVALIIYDLGIIFDRNENKK